MQAPNLIQTPPFLQRLQWVNDPVTYMEGAVQQYPDIFYARIVGFGGNIIFVNSPQGIQEVLTNDRKKYAALGTYNKVLQPIVGDYSLLMIDGDRHKRRRQLVMPSFHGERMHVYGQEICDITEKVFSQIPPNHPFTARTLTQQISLRVILKTVFGVTESARGQALNQQLLAIANLFRSPLTSSFLFFPFLQKDLGSWSPWGKFIRDRAATDELIYAEIAERRRNNDLNRTDILSLLISSRDENGEPMTDQELRDELITILMAGYETTASSIAWGLYLTAKHPDVLAKLLEELDTLGDSPNPMHIFKLPYLTAVCNEIMRICPVAILTFPRIAQERVELLGQTLEPGTGVVGCIYLLHQREDLYPQPKQFKPERFLERQFSPYEFMPFGAGVRRCLGEALAMFEMKLVLATVLSRYKLALADHQPESLKRRGVTLGPARGVKMIMIDRRVK